IGAFVFGDLAGADASRRTPYEGELPLDQLEEGRPHRAGAGRPGAATVVRRGSGDQGQWAP
ncbi:hypothetical protein, partial [Streptomyces rochei]|uniref:hypothetical protein n=1 Tax=Streptomyces rochei TaxID=1928 RepID=UPI0033A86B5E